VWTGFPVLSACADGVKETQHSTGVHTVDAGDVYS
jgi:hypothetical protein